MNIVMTGGTSGLGEVAAQQFIAAGHRVYLAARNAKIGGAVCYPVNLMDLGSVYGFANSLSDWLSGAPVDALVLNAGGNGGGTTPEGYDGTFVVNYLAHYLLLYLLRDKLAADAIIVLTTSGTHDPENRSRMPAPNHADAEWLARPESDPHLDENATTLAARAYASAKLCIAVLAHQLVQEAKSGNSGIRTVLYDPGPTPGTGLSRGMNPLFRLLWGPFSGLMRNLLPGANTVEAAGSTLAHIALGQVRPPDSGVYPALRDGQITWRHFTPIAADTVVAEKLIQDSARLLNLPSWRGVIETTNKDG